MHWQTALVDQGIPVRLVRLLKVIFGKMFGTSQEVAWNLWFQNTNFQTLRRFATLAVAQTDGLRLSRKEAVVVSNPEISSSRIPDIKICIFTCVFEQFVFVELEERNVAASRSPWLHNHTGTTLQTCWRALFSEHFGRLMGRPMLTEAP